MNNSGRRWAYLVVGTLILLFLGLIYAWSLFRTPFGALFPAWSVSQMSMTFTVSIVFFCLGGFLGGQLAQRTSVRLRFLLAAICLFAGFLGVSLLSVDDPGGSLIKLYLCYGVLGGGGVGIGYNAVMTTVTRWFPDKVGMASGILLMGFGLGSLVLGSIVESTVAALGLFFTFRLLALATAVVLIAGAVMLRAPEGSVTAANQREKDAVSEADAADDAGELSSGEMLRTGRFWFFFLWSILLSAAGLMVINSAANISVAYGGSAILGMIVSLFNGAGRILIGTWFDRKGRRSAMFIDAAFMLLAGLLMVIGGMSNRIFWIVIGLVFVGMSYGGCPTMTSAYINRAFGAKHFTSNYSIANFALLPAAIIGPMISAKLIESAGGAYTTNFYAILLFTAAALVCLLLLNRCDGSGDAANRRSS